jgi:NAD(P)-dependent dehydrogenase (short-subunit alcohol dehydrogenase family)
MIGLMNVLQAEGAKNDIRINTLAPTAATRMTAGILPPEVQHLMAPEAITPAVLYLVSEQAPSRIIMSPRAFFCARKIARRRALLPASPKSPTSPRHGRWRAPSNRLIVTYAGPPPRWASPLRRGNRRDDAGRGCAAAAVKVRPRLAR